MKLDLQKTSFLNFGTAQTDRVIPALIPENLRIDDREIHDYIAFCMQIAGTLNYVNFNNEVEGTWAQFFEKDPSIFLALLANEQPKKLDNEVRNLIQGFYQAQDDRLESIKLEILQSMVRQVLFLIQKLNTWYVNSLTLLVKQNENQFTTILLQILKTSAPSVRIFWSLLLSIKKRNWFSTDDLDWEQQLENLHTHWTLELDKAGEYPLERNTKQAQHQFMEELRQIFQTLHLQLIFLNQKAPGWLQESLTKKKDHEPHIGLLLAFLQLFLHARDQMNTYPKKHLDHYYFDWLHQKTNPFVPDRTIVGFQLADQIKKYVLPKGASLLAGVNENGLASLYNTVESIVLNDSKIDNLQSIYISKSPLQQAGSSYRLITGIYATPVANTKDGLGTPSFNKAETWPPFGEEQLEISLRDRQMVDARIGFIIAAPVLWLQEADREIDLNFQFTAATLSILLNLVEDISFNTERDIEEVVSNLFYNALQISVSTPEGWFQIQRWKIDSPSQWLQTGAITLQLFLSNQDPPIVDNRAEVLGESYPSNWPLLKIVLNADHHVYLYSFVNKLELELIEITTRVKGLKSLSLINEIGPIDASGSFQPFGPIPNSKAYLLVGCQELFSKRITDLSLHLDWQNLPDDEGGLAEHFREYHQSIDNHAYQVQLSALSSSTFKPNQALETTTFPLFVADQDDQLLSRTSIENFPIQDLQIKPDYKSRKLAEFNRSAQSGYFKLQLNGPKMAFGHVLYNQLFAKAMIEQAQASSNFFARLTESPKEIPFPKAPFTPLISRLSIDYTASTRLNFIPTYKEENDEYAGEKVFKLHPYGYQEIFFETKAIDRFLFPQFEEDGYLFIGLSQVVPNQSLHLFFQLTESKKASSSDEIEIQWSYLSMNQWEIFPTDALLADHTHKFTTSGIIKLALPDEIQMQNDLMPPGRFWIRVSAKGNLDIVGRVLKVQTNAVEVVWVDNGDTAHFNPQVPRPPIQGLFSAIPEITSSAQLLDFYGDRPAEQATAFYTRISERLRHKSRAINNWDFEHLILEQFPDLWQVKCIGPMQDPTLPGGEITIVVVPKITGNELEPKIGFNQLESIEAFISPKISPFVKVKAINPVYEKLKINAQVFLLRELEAERGAYLKRLHEELLHFICPWLRSGVLPLGGYLSKNELFDFIKSRPYIKYATGFSLVHIFQQNENEHKLVDTAAHLMADELIRATTPASVLIPLTQHNIQFIDSAKHSDPVATAIDGMRLGTDFIVAAEEVSSESGLRDVPDKAEKNKKTWVLSPKGQ